MFTGEYFPHPTGTHATAPARRNADLARRECVALPSTRRWANERGGRIRMGAWAIGILPLVGVVLGAALQFWLESSRRTRATRGNPASQAYADYLRAVAAAGHLRSDDDLRDAHRDAADAKARIAVYGTAEVIKALSQFEEAGAVISDGPVRGVRLQWSPPCGPLDVRSRTTNWSCFCWALPNKAMHLSALRAAGDRQGVRHTRSS